MNNNPPVAVAPQKIEKPVAKTAHQLKNEAIEKALSNEIISNKKHVDARKRAAHYVG